MGRIIFVTGGARSGKSDYALEQADLAAGSKVFIATAEPADTEMAERINAHKLQRSSGWKAIEEQVNLADALADTANEDVVIVDCLTLWVSNMLCREIAPEPMFDSFICEMKRERAGTLYIVSNEIGMGIVPDNALSRRFRDMAGKLNRMTAQAADEAVLVISGIALTIKS
ncbi:MAG: bifunctional adenosylcobinamide kinase/adenosylcobinamide-phosphate guanylyltransferase [Nitrospirae bacterium]|nr:bifunctional adenosylcobinamide kinase/adenosylcobinamide-phosphate guanylyltransferase [Nitrospirota bacterium]